MHRSDIDWSAVALLGALLAMGGCRWQHPESQVQISPGPRTFSKQLEPPASRLVGAEAEMAPAGETLADQGVVKQTALSDSEKESLKAAFEGLSPEMRALAEQRIAVLEAQEAPTPQGNSAQKPPQETPAPAPAVGQAEAAVDVAIAEPSAAKPKDGDEAVDSTPAANAESSHAAEPAPSEVAKAEGDRADTEESEQVGVDIRRAVGEGLAKADGQVEPASATVPVADPLSAASDEQLFQQLIQRYRKRTLDEARDESATSDVVVLRTLTTLAGDPDAAVTPVDGWSSSEQEFLNYQMLALWQLVDPQSHPVRKRRWTMALPELRQATSHLAAATGDLDVRGLSFCTEVLGYGQTKPFPADRFTAGQQVILYSELENFVAERLSDGYETHLLGTYQIFDAAGKRVADQVLPEDRQICSNYRRDYYIAYGLYLPSRLAPGSYRLELTMEDLKGKTYGQASIPLEITK